MFSLEGELQHRNQVLPPDDRHLVRHYPAEKYKIYKRKKSILLLLTCSQAQFNEMREI